MINGHFKTTSGHVFANYMNIFHKTEIQTCLAPQFCERYSFSCKKNWPEVVLKRPFPNRKFWETPSMYINTLARCLSIYPPINIGRSLGKYKENIKLWNTKCTRHTEGSKRFPGIMLQISSDIQIRGRNKSFHKSLSP